MLLESFSNRFIEIAELETRGVNVVVDDFLPIGEFGFLEFYCTDKKCDCRRVVIKVTSRDSRVWATISYGWGSKKFYTKWASGDKEMGAMMAGASLDPLNIQSVHAQKFLIFFRSMVANDKAYVERLKAHYQMFRK